MVKTWTGTGAPPLATSTPAVATPLPSQIDAQPRRSAEPPSLIDGDQPEASSSSYRTADSGTSSGVPLDDLDCFLATRHRLGARAHRLCTAKTAAAVTSAASSPLVSPNTTAVSTPPLATVGTVQGALDATLTSPPSSLVLTAHQDATDLDPGFDHSPSSSSSKKATQSTSSDTKFEKINTPLARLRAPMPAPLRRSNRAVATRARTSARASSLANLVAISSSLDSEFELRSSSPPLPSSKVLFRRTTRSTIHRTPASAAAETTTNSRQCCQTMRKRVQFAEQTPERTTESSPQIPPATSDTLGTSRKRYSRPAANPTQRAKWARVNKSKDVLHPQAPPPMSVLAFEDPEHQRKFEECQKKNLIQGRYPDPDTMRALDFGDDLHRRITSIG